MPSFNIFKSFGSSKPSRPTPIAPFVVKDYGYPPPNTQPSALHSRSASLPPEIIKSQPLSDPSLARRGTLKKKHRYHHHFTEDTSHTHWPEAQPEYVPQNDILPGPPPATAPLRQSPIYQPANPSIYAEERPYPYEDHHLQRPQYATGANRGSSMQGYEDTPFPGMYEEPPLPHSGVQHEYDRHHNHDPHRPSHHHRHRHHRHHHPSQSPQHLDYDDAYAPGPMQGRRDDSWGSNRARSRSRSYTPIPSVYREPDSIDSYADPFARGHPQRRSGHGPGELDEYGHPLPAPRIGWRPSDTGERMNEGGRDMNDPEATLVGNPEPQIITPPFESDNPLQTNVHHTREPEYSANRGHRHRTPAQEFAHQSRHDPGQPRGGLEASHESRKKVYMYADYHYSDTIEPKMYERQPKHGETDSEPEEYRYIVPSGVQVVFRDHGGEEIARIGYPGPISSGSRPRNMTPFTVQDEYGKILYRHEGLASRYRDDGHTRHGEPRTTKVIMIDERGNQVPLKSNSHSGRSQQSHRSHHSHHSRHSHRSHHSQHSPPSHRSHHSQHSPPSHHSHHSQPSHGSGKRRDYY